MKKNFSFFAAVLFAGSMMATEVTDVLNNGLTGVSGTNYTSWSGKQSNSTAVYAGQSAGSNESIQLRSKNSNSGVVTTTSGGTLKSITVTFNANTAATRKVDVYASNVAYTSPTELYGNAAVGTKVASFNIDNGATQTYTFTESYTFIGFRSADGALYLDEVKITWETGSDAPAVAKPVISGDAKFYDEAEVSMTCVTEDAVIYYTTDETFSTSPSETDWTPYSAALTINTTTTVWAAALKGSEWSEVAEKTFTKNPSFESFDALVAAELADHTLVEVAFENVEIDSIYSNKSGKRQGIYFTVGETAYEIYFNQNEVPAAWVAGGKVSGTLRGEWTVYNDIWELKPETGFVWAEDLTYVAPSATAISNTAVEAKAVKSLENGMLVIEKAGKKYNVMGQIIK